MKKKLLLTASFILLNTAILRAGDLFWLDATPGNINDATHWDALSTPGSQDRLYFGIVGDYTIGATGDLTITSLETRGASGVVTFDLGAYKLDATSTFIVNRDTVWSSGAASGNLQIANGVQEKSFTITGSNSAFTVVSAMLGRSSANASADSNQWTLSNGASLNVTKNALVIGNNDVNSLKSANGNSFLVIGAGTVLSATTGGIIIGNLATDGVGAASSNNSMKVEDGAVVETSSLTIGRRAPTSTSNAAATGNSLTVGGNGSAAMFTSNGTVAIGPVGGNNVVNVKKGGTFTAKGNTTVNNRAGNAINITGGTYDASGTTVLLYQNGLLNLDDGGSLLAKTLDLRGTLKATGGNTVTLDALVSDTTAIYRFVLKGAHDYTKITIAHDAQFGGVLNITLDAGYTPLSGDTFQLFSFAGSTGSFTQINLPTLGNGLGWDTTTLYQNGTIQVIPEPRTAAIQLSGIAAMCLLWTLKKR